MTARLATHPDVALHAPDVLRMMTVAGVDVEHISDRGSGAAALDPLRSVRESSLDLALVGVQALRGTAADGLTLLAVFPREDPRDILVAIEGPSAPLRALPAGSRVGAAGLRRLAFLHAHRPDARAR